jgi:DNA-3-methyladenine glycosylase II
MAGRVAEFEVLGPWSLQTSRRFWEGFTPAAPAGDPVVPGLRAVFCAEGDWRRAEARVTQAGDTARVVLTRAEPRSFVGGAGGPSRCPLSGSAWRV